MKKKRNIILFVSIAVVALIWGAVYWYYVMPVIDPR